MHQLLTQLIDTKLEEAAAYITRHLPVALPVNAIYEGLISDDAMLEAFRNAVKYLPPSSLHRRLVLKFSGETMGVNVRLTPTEKYPVFLMPSNDVEVTPKSELGQALEVVCKVASDWNTLAYAWGKLRDTGINAHAAGFIFPWLRDIFLDFNFNMLSHAPKLKAERELILREVAQLRNRLPPSHFPRMSHDLSKVCQSGKGLFAQYRMLESAANQAELARAPLAIDRTHGVLVPDWVQEHVGEAIYEWLAEERKRANAYRERIVNARMKRRAKSRGW